MTRKLARAKLLIATHNRGKLDEIRALLDVFGMDVVSNADFGLPEPAETETTFVGNARIKALAGVKATGLPTLADDSGLAVEALGGAPGVYTADWAETPNGRDFAMAMARVYEELLASGAPQPWRAKFCCTLVLAWDDGHEEVFEGEVHGQIVWPPRGPNGHGYDPIFQADGMTETFGEMDPIEKNFVSHRANAFEKLVKGCFV
ncbi:XTP/dITP diphosphohydrolase [Ketogulonicigenium robustum]|uniref:dITP/XTP pyrophosphatase n=1 Tax=Ketogulonicigenium robustum TaxID=92947 RepID=A0A1W6P2M8_9RHOB|nr:RdgB/HAM1 family non-canonical purine NTP pyrophosphatase [Ketogulonicigenium robustum]ARO15689.1 XTP/dITP diphosphohydrolase [Ketogulonicigenium robustum]